MSSGDETAPKSKRGGKRPGAGRKPKGHKATSALPALDLEAALAAPAPDDIESTAQAYSRGAIASLVKQLCHGKSESSKVNAANAILDRGYGKPSVDVGGLSQLSLFGGIRPAAVVGDEIRVEARKYANLAIEVLGSIATRGETESARVSAAKSLLDRGVGTVQVAKVPEGLQPKTLGKKEEAAVAARNAAAGKYAPPPAPGARRIETVQ
ncbi:hypothetical protein PMI42_04850 [Bradyrhizobium sp. YR681]|nr:hypothetical protein PMI42_04850 [Bradyrhizobium sp. YR681]